MLIKRAIPIAVLSLLYLHAFATELQVGENCPYANIQDAVEKAASGDTILIHPGTYRVNNLSIEKPVHLRGMTGSIVDGQQKGTVFFIRSDNVTVEGLHIKNTGISSIKDLAAFRVENSENCTIRKSTVTNTQFAIYISGSSGCNVSENYIEGKDLRETSSGNGIHIWKSDSCIVSENKIKGQRDGIYLEFSKGSIINGNISSDNLRYGLHFMFSNGNIYRDNIFSRNGAGVAVMYSEDILMENNTFSDNWGTASYGLLLKDIKRSKITGNRFTKNTIGIYMEASGKLNISGNRFSENGWAMKLLGNCEEDSVTNNAFISNSFDLVTNSHGTGESNYLGFNYWDKYKGYDLNKDGTGDVPYRPVSLFSIYVERIPSATLLIKSFTSDLLDAVERAMPALIPESLCDHHPKMKNPVESDDHY